jgi:hypothetical protein
LGLTRSKTGILWSRADTAIASGRWLFIKGGFATYRARLQALVLVDELVRVGAEGDTLTLRIECYHSERGWALDLANIVDCVLVKVGRRARVDALSTLKEKPRGARLALQRTWSAAHLAFRRAHLANAATVEVGAHGACEVAVVAKHDVAWRALPDAEFLIQLR